MNQLGKNKRKMLYLLLFSLLSIKVTGCSNEKEQENVIAETISDYDFSLLDGIKDINREELNTEVSLEMTSKILEKKELKRRKFKEIKSIIANTNVNIRKSPTIAGELAGKLVEGHTLELLEELNNGWYKVLYYDQVCYVSEEFTSKTITYQVNDTIKKLCYVPKGVENVEITIPAEVSSSEVEEKVNVPTLEFFEVYEETKDSYLVQTSDYIGYVDKNFLEELPGPIAVVDISNQNFKYYLNNKVVLETPVVTGKPSTPSDEGLFKIYKFKKNDYLRGPGYKSYVDVMMFYNQGEGFHDASRHYCTNGKQNNHGWRAEWQFGGDTYLTNGSHGCVNMPNYAATKLYNYVEEGTLVLIKK